MNTRGRIQLKPMSINQAYRGRRYKTQLYKDYIKGVLWQLKVERMKRVEGWVMIEYEFYIKHYKRTDVGNLEKPLTDILVKADLIDDDKFVKGFKLVKHRVQGNESEHIKIKISPYDVGAEG